MHYWANGLVHVWICSEGPPLTYSKNSHPFWLQFCCPKQLSTQNHNASIILAVFVYCFTLTRKLTFKYKSLQKSTMKTQSVLLRLIWCAWCAKLYLPISTADWPKYNLKSQGVLIRLVCCAWCGANGLVRNCRRSLHKMTGTQWVLFLGMLCLVCVAYGLVRSCMT